MPNQLRNSPGEESATTATDRQPISSLPLVFIMIMIIIVFLYYSSQFTYRHQYNATLSITASLLIKVDSVA